MNLTNGFKRRSSNEGTILPKVGNKTRAHIDEEFEMRNNNATIVLTQNLSPREPRLTLQGSGDPFSRFASIGDLFPSVAPRNNYIASLIQMDPSMPLLSDLMSPENLLVETKLEGFAKSVANISATKLNPLTKKPSALKKQLANTQRNRNKSSWMNEYQQQPPPVTEVVTHRTHGLQSAHGTRVNFRNLLKNSTNTMKEDQKASTSTDFFKPVQPMVPDEGNYEKKIASLKRLSNDVAPKEAKKLVLPPAIETPKLSKKALPQPVSKINLVSMVAAKKAPQTLPVLTSPKKVEPPPQIGFIEALEVQNDPKRISGFDWHPKEKPNPSILPKAGPIPLPDTWKGKSKHHSTKSIPTNLHLGQALPVRTENEPRVEAMRQSRDKTMSSVVFPPIQAKFDPIDLHSLDKASSKPGAKKVARDTPTTDELPDLRASMMRSIVKLEMNAERKENTPKASTEQKEENSRKISFSPTPTPPMSPPTDERRQIKPDLREERDNTESDGIPSPGPLTHRTMTNDHKPDDSRISLVESREVTPEQYQPMKGAATERKAPPSFGLRTRKRAENTEDEASNSPPPLTSDRIRRRDVIGTVNLGGAKTARDHRDHTDGFVSKEPTIISQNQHTNKSKKDKESNDVVHAHNESEIQEMSEDRILSSEKNSESGRQQEISEDIFSHERSERQQTPERTPPLCSLQQVDEEISPSPKNELMRSAEFVIPAKMQTVPALPVQDTEPDPAVPRVNTGESHSSRGIIEERILPIEEDIKSKASVPEPSHRISPPEELREIPATPKGNVEASTKSAVIFDFGPKPSAFNEGKNVHESIAGLVPLVPQKDHSVSAVTFGKQMRGSGSRSDIAALENSEPRGVFNSSNNNGGAVVRESMQGSLKRVEMIASAEVTVVNQLEPIKSMSVLEHNEEDAGSPPASMPVFEIGEKPMSGIDLQADAVGEAPKVAVAEIAIPVESKEVRKPERSEGRPKRDFPLLQLKKPNFMTLDDFTREQMANSRATNLFGDGKNLSSQQKLPEQEIPSPGFASTPVMPSRNEQESRLQRETIKPEPTEEDENDVIVTKKESLPPQPVPTPVAPAILGNQNEKPIVKQVSKTEAMEKGSRQIARVDSPPKLPLEKKLPLAAIIEPPSEHQEEPSTPLDHRETLNYAPEEITQTVARVQGDVTLQANNEVVIPLEEHAEVDSPRLPPDSNSEKVIPTTAPELYAPEHGSSLQAMQQNPTVPDMTILAKESELGLSPIAALDEPSNVSAENPAEMIRHEATPPSKEPERESTPPNQPQEKESAPSSLGKEKPVITQVPKQEKETAPPHKVQDKSPDKQEEKTEIPKRPALRTERTSSLENVDENVTTGAVAENVAGQGKPRSLPPKLGMMKKKVISVTFTQKKDNSQPLLPSIQALSKIRQSIQGPTGDYSHFSTSSLITAGDALALTKSPRSPVAVVVDMGDFDFKRGRQVGNSTEAKGAWKRRHHQQEKEAEDDDDEDESIHSDDMNFEDAIPDSHLDQLNKSLDIFYSEMRNKENAMMVQENTRDIHTPEVTESKNFRKLGETAPTIKGMRGSAYTSSFRVQADHKPEKLAPGAINESFESVGQSEGVHNTLISLSGRQLGQYTGNSKERAKPAAKPSRSVLTINIIPPEPEAPPVEHTENVAEAQAPKMNIQKLTFLASRRKSGDLRTLPKSSDFIEEFNTNMNDEEEPGFELKQRNMKIAREDILSLKRTLDETYFNDKYLKDSSTSIGELVIKRHQDTLDDLIKNWNSSRRAGLPLELRADLEQEHNHLLRPTSNNTKFKITLQSQPYIDIVKGEEVIDRDLFAGESESKDNGEIYVVESRAQEYDNDLMKSEEEGQIELLQSGERIESVEIMEKISGNFAPPSIITSIEKEKQDDLIGMAKLDFTPSAKSEGKDDIASAIEKQLTKATQMYTKQLKTKSGGIGIENLGEYNEWLRGTFQWSFDVPKREKKAANRMKKAIKGELLSHNPSTDPVISQRPTINSEEGPLRIPSNKTDDKGFWSMGSTIASNTLKVQTTPTARSQVGASIAFRQDLQKAQDLANAVGMIEEEKQRSTMLPRPSIIQTSSDLMPSRNGSQTPGTSKAARVPLRIPLAPPVIYSEREDRVSTLNTPGTNVVEEFFPDRPLLDSDGQFPQRTEKRSFTTKEDQIEVNGPEIAMQMRTEQRPGMNTSGKDDQKMNSAGLPPKKHTNLVIGGMNNEEAPAKPKRRLGKVPTQVQLVEPKDARSKPDELDARAKSPGLRLKIDRRANHSEERSILKSPLKPPADPIAGAEPQEPIFTSMKTQKFESGNMNVNAIRMRNHLQQVVKKHNLEPIQQMQMAIMENKPHELRELILNYPNTWIDTPNANGDTLLLTAAKMGNLDIINLLLQRGASVKVQNANGDNPLHFALAYKNMDAADLLIQHEVGQNVRNKQGKTPWDMAAY